MRVGSASTIGCGQTLLSFCALRHFGNYFCQLAALLVGANAGSAVRALYIGVAIIEGTCRAGRRGPPRASPSPDASLATIRLTTPAHEQLEGPLPTVDAMRASVGGLPDRLLRSSA